jgi:hypothetical protein
MILSLPNSGTDWLCRILAKHGKGDGLRYYEKEFFNPICNPKYAMMLEPVFGCELAYCHENIGIWSEVQDEELEAVYQDSWACESYNFDKENYSALKVRFFARHFELVFLFRPVENVFPPSRLRVWAWYDAIYSALVATGMIEETGPIDLEGRSVAAHKTCWDVMWKEAEAIGAPVLDYERLCKAGSVEDVADHLGRGWIARAVDVPAAAAEIFATRRYENKAATDR